MGWLSIPRHSPRRDMHARHASLAHKPAISESRYFLIFIDDATRMMYLFVLETKTAKEVYECFLEFRNIFEQDGRRIKWIRTDGGGEYRKQMAGLCKELDEETAPYTPEQNGIAERANRTIWIRAPSYTETIAASQSESVCSSDQSIRNLIINHRDTPAGFVIFGKSLYVRARLVVIPGGPGFGR
jgi:hypothetical protein